MKGINGDGRKQLQPSKRGSEIGQISKLAHCSASVSSRAKRDKGHFLQGWLSQRNAVPVQCGLAYRALREYQSQLQEAGGGLPRSRSPAPAQSPVEVGARALMLSGWRKHRWGCLWLGAALCKWGVGSQGDQELSFLAGASAGSSWRHIPMRGAGSCYGSILRLP